MTAPSLRRSSVPWSLSDARSTFVANVVGVGLLISAWWASGGTADLERQTARTILGVLAVGLIALGNLFWVMSAGRAVRRRRTELIDRVDRFCFGLEASFGASGAPSG